MNNIETEKTKGVSSMRRVVDPVGYLLTEAFHGSAFCNLPGDRLGRDCGLFKMTAKGSASIEDLLLLFIYLEIGSIGSASSNTACSVRINADRTGRAVHFSISYPRRLCATLGVSRYSSL